jgi:arginase
VSTLRARCPDCRTLTAVALDEGEYECHSCGRSFGGALVRVPRAWGAGGEAMAEAAYLALPYPEAGVVDEDALSEQNLALACALPARPVVLGGCCCAHVGAVEGLATRYDRLGVVWFDAHGDLNTPDSSPSGNAWGMALRMLLDSGTISPSDTVLVGARNLDPPEQEFIGTSGLHTGENGLAEALSAVDAVYVAFDCDVLDPDEEVVSFFLEAGGLTLVEALAIMKEVASVKSVAGAGFSGLAPDPVNVPALTRACGALGL